MMCHFTNESTSTGRLPWVRKRSGSASSYVRMRMSKWRTFCTSGSLKCRPGLVTTSFTSPSWNTMACWRWSTVKSVPETSRPTRMTTARIGPMALIARSPVGPVAIAQRVARARPGVRRGRRLARPLRGLRLGRIRRAARLVPQLLERQHEEIARAAVVEHHLVGGGQDLAHRVDVDALARHLRRLRVLGEHLAEARRVALGVGDHALLVALGLLLQARGRAARARDHVVGVRLAFVLLALAVLAGLHRVVERGLHLLRRLGVLQRHRAHLDAGVVAVVDRLHEIARLVGDVD